MINIMLCGAEDTDIIKDPFVNVVTGFGGNALSYLLGNIEYENTSQASFTKNSIDTVKKANLCVFVIIDTVGKITWNTELISAVREGKPFIVLCESKLYTKYKNVRSINGLEPNLQELVDLIRYLEENNQFTIISFELLNFEHVLRDQLALMFTKSIELLELRNKRTICMKMSNTNKINLEIIESIALDETEDKNSRKRAISILKDFGVDNDTYIALLSSLEQGVTRLCIELLDELIKNRPFPEEIMQYCVKFANENDDIGIIRRLIPKLLRIDLKNGIMALKELDTTEIGTRRRIVSELLEYEESIKSERCEAVAIEIANKCLMKTEESGWKSQCMGLIQRLESE